MKYKTIDLCAGIGGIRRGFEMTNHFENVLSAEIDKYAVSTYKHLFGDNPYNDLTSEEFKRLVDTTDYQVLLAGFPCQSFSKIGKQLGFRDSTRGTVFFDIADIISRTNPMAIFLENVENLISHDSGNTIETIISTLENELNYEIVGVRLDKNGAYKYDRSSLVRNTRNFGLPQNRPRVYIMGFSRLHFGNALKLLNGQLPTDSSKTVFSSIREILESDVDDKYYLAQGYLDTLKRHKERNKNKGNGFGYCVLNNPCEPRDISYTLLATGGSGRERNLIYQPKKNIAGKMITGKKTGLNSEGIRVMTPTEWGKLQGFIGYAFINEFGIDTFEFPKGMPDVQKYKQLGNSVSIPVVEAMANYMLDCFKKMKKEQFNAVEAIAKKNATFTKRDVMDSLKLPSFRAEELLDLMVKNKKIRSYKYGGEPKYQALANNNNARTDSQEEIVIRIARERKRINNHEICRILNTSANNTNVLLSNMVKKGRLVRIERGKYALGRNV